MWSLPSVAYKYVLKFDPYLIHAFLDTLACFLIHADQGHLCTYYIRITCLCNIYPLIPHFYIAKLGYARLYLFFLISKH